MKRPDGTTHSATFQPDLCEALTPATVVVWLRQRGRELHGKGNTTDAVRLALAAETIERTLVTP